MPNTAAIEQLISQLKEVNMAANNLLAAKSFPDKPEDLVSAAERVSEALESTVVTSRNTLEMLRLNMEIPKPGAPALPYINISGAVRVIEYNWLHIKLNTLLPHCRFQTPLYLSDTITRLLDNYAANGRKIPYYENALLVIDEHCDIQSRTVFDPDNKGWKAVSNALKGRVFPDDDQFSLGVSLVSARSEKPACNIFVIGVFDAGEFFNMRSGGLLYW